MEMILATQNKHKIEEFREMLENDHIYALDQFHDQDDVVEDGQTFHDNAILKARYFAIKYQKYALADDSGLSVEALNGKPGIYSKRYSGGTDQDNNLKLLDEMKDKTNRKAYFTSVIALCSPEGVCDVFEGRLCGKIATFAKGNHGFGYDPIFIVDGLDRHLAELSVHEKNEISHRSEALKKVKVYVDAYFDHK